MDLDDALAKIESQFGRKRPTKEEFVDSLVARGKACVMCRKVRCDCDCWCAACWGKPR